MSDRPDAFIADPSKSIVLEVKAGEVVPSDVYPCRYTLRFPRVLKIRFDKDWHEGLWRVARRRIQKCARATQMDSTICFEGWAI